MAKSKTQYVCQNCGTTRAKWEGRCSDCGEWNTLVEEVKAVERKGWVSKNSGETSKSRSAAMDVYNLIDTPTLDFGQRISTGLNEVDRVLGGGLVRGSYVLLGGDPGIGKSTLIMQVAGRLGTQGRNVLYVSAEESVQQTALRARRLGLEKSQVHLASESSLDLIVDTCLGSKPDLLIVDSIQTVFTTDVESAPGSVSQVRECASRLLSLAKSKGVTVVLIGHVTKDGSLAGPRVLEHMVDTVLSFEGDHHQQFRLLRALKNRFGATNELGVFQMAGDGLNQVLNPSEFFLEERQGHRSGSAVFAAIEGSRPLLCEIQALCSSSNLPSPRRNSIGLDINRVHMLTAVLEKHTALSFNNKDVYANVVGGLRLNEPAIDLALVAALVSAERQIALPANACFFGEVGLTGEVRATHMASERIKEAEKLGLCEVFLPKSNERHLNLKDLKLGNKLKFHWVSDVAQLVDRLMGQNKKDPAKNRSAPTRETPAEMEF